jgi:hypothetical protein
VPLTDKQREYVINTAVDLLRHHRCARLLEILGKRISEGDYPEGLEGERDLDRVAHAIARAMERELGGEGRDG